jgi:hypothetical protein
VNDSGDRVLIPSVPIRLSSEAWLIVSYVRPTPLPNPPPDHRSTPTWYAFGARRRVLSYSTFPMFRL